MTIPETVIIVLAALAAVFALAALIVACVRRRGDGVDADTLNDVRKMLEESANLRAQEIQSAVNNAKDVTLSVINQSNSSVATAIGTYLKGSGESMDKLIENTAKEMKEFRVTQEQNTEKINTGVEKSLKELKEETVRSIEKMQEDIRRQYADTRQELRANLDDIKKELTDNLGKVREDNNKQLEKMRETVDEKLSKTLEQRLTASFDIVKKELDSVNKNLQEMQTATTSRTSTECSKTSRREAIGARPRSRLCLKSFWTGRNTKSSSGSRVRTESTLQSRCPAATEARSICP